MAADLTAAITGLTVALRGGGAGRNDTQDEERDSTLSSQRHAVVN